MKILYWSIVAQHGVIKLFQKGLNNCSFREFGKVPERSPTSKRSASKQLSTLLKKMWEVCQDSRLTI